MPQIVQGDRRKFRGDRLLSPVCIADLLDGAEVESVELSHTADITAFSDVLNPASGPTR